MRATSCGLRTRQRPSERRVLHRDRRSRPRSARDTAGRVASLTGSRINYSIRHSSIVPKHVHEIYRQ